MLFLCEHALANSVTGAAIVSDNGDSTNSLNRVIVVTLPANNSTTVTIGNIPYGTTYNITETAPTTDYSSTPIEIKYQNDTIVEEMKGTVNAATTSYLVTDKHEVGSLNLKDVVIDRGKNALYYAGVNQLKNKGQANEYIDYTKYDYYVVLESPDGIDLKDYISMDDLDNIISFTDDDVLENYIIEYTDRDNNVTTKSTSTSASSKYKFHIDVTSSVDGAKTISNIPIGTKYSVVEVAPTATYHGTESSATSTDYTGAGASWFGTAGVPANDPGTITLNYQSAKDNNSPTVTITNYYRHPEASISVEKALADGDNDTDHKNKSFSFTIDLDIAGFNSSRTSGTPAITLAASDLAYTYTPTDADGNGASASFANNKISVTLKPGQKVKIDGIPVGIKYKVTETTNDWGWSSKYTINGGSEQNGSATSGNETTDINTEQAVKFTNTYSEPDTASLSLTKNTSDHLAPGMDASTAYFKFTVDLTAPTASPANGSFDHYTIGATQADSTISATSTTAKNGSNPATMQYVFYLKKNQALSITGVPNGTGCTITEDTDHYYTYNSTTSSYDEHGYTKSVYKPTGSYDTTEPTSLTGTVTRTYTNTYTPLGSLQLQKDIVLIGDTPYPSDVSDISPFNYTVKLTLPAGMSWTQQYIEAIGLTYSTTNPAYTVSSVSGSDNRVITFTKAVSKTGTNANVTISNIPYNTTYEVKENYTQPAGYTWTPTPTGATISGRIGENYSGANPSSQSTAKITNTYVELGSIVLDKTVQAATGSTLPTGAVVQTFTFDVTLTAPDMNTDLSQFITESNIQGLSGSVTHTPADSTATPPKPSSCTFKVSIADKKTTDVNAENMTRTISNIPIGTKYTVTELTAVMPTIDGYHIVPSGGEDNATLSHSATNQVEVEIKNTYHKHLKLTVSKAVEGTPPTNIPNTNKEYTLLVTLTEPANDSTKAFSNYPVAIESTSNTAKAMYDVNNENEAGSAKASRTITSGSTFAIKLKNGESVDFTGLPVGTTYTITESTNSQKDTTSVAYLNNTNSTGMTTDVSASVTNEYKTGELKLQKAFVNDTTAASGFKFKYHIALSLPTGSHVASHLTLADYESNIKKRAYGESSASPVGTITNGVFDVEVEQGKYVVISGIPQGVAYTVTELGPTADGWTQIDSSNRWRNSDESQIWIQNGTSNTSGTISGTQNEATITNLLTGSLQINKNLVGKTFDSAQNFTVKVTLSKSGITDFTNYPIKAGGTAVTWANSGTSKTEFTVNVPVSANQSSGNITITGIPCGTECTVEETESHEANGTSYNPTDGKKTIDTTPQTVGVTNTYGGCSLTVAKTVDNRPSGLNTDNPDYTFKVTLTNTDPSKGLAYNKLSFVRSDTYVSTFTPDTNGFYFTVTMKSGQNLQINGIPDGTQYTVEETSSKDGIKEVDVQVDSEGFVKKTDYKSRACSHKKSIKNHS